MAIGLLLALVRASSRAALLIAVAPSVFLVAFSLLFLVQLRKTVPGYGFLFVPAGIAVTQIVSGIWGVMRRIGRLSRRIFRPAAAVVLLLLMPRSSRSAVIAGGEQHSVAVQPDGFVITWGNDLYGQLGDGEFRPRYWTTLPQRVKGIWDVVAVAAGAYHTVALKADGSVWAWGDNRWGELGDGTRTTRGAPKRVARLRRIVEASAGSLHTLALDEDGAVWSWGNNLYGQLGAEERDRLRPAKIDGLPRIVHVAAGVFHSVAIDADGRVWTWGQNTRGQLGDGTHESRRVPRRIVGVDHVLNVSAGRQHTLALLRDGNVMSWGGNTNGQLGFRTGPAGSGGGFGPDVLRPAMVPAIHDVVQAAAGGDFSLVVTAGHEVWGWGNNLYGELGDGSWTPHVDPVRVPIEGTITEVAAADAHVIALRVDGAVWSWGFGHYGQLGLTAERRVAQPRRIETVSLQAGPNVDYFSKKFLAMTSKDLEFKDPLTRMDATRLHIVGEAKGDSYAAVFGGMKGGPSTKHRTFVAVGEVRHGGVTVGVQVAGKWVWERTFWSVGPIRLSWTPPSDADYRIVVEHSIPPAVDRRTPIDHHMDIELSRVGWFDGE
jgi:alpha-tubulin suppressor-like RCC1 family protein